MESSYRQRDVSTGNMRRDRFFLAMPICVGVEAHLRAWKLHSVLSRDSMLSNSKKFDSWSVYAHQMVLAGSCSSSMSNVLGTLDHGYSLCQRQTLFVHRGRRQQHCLNRGCLKLTVSTANAFLRPSWRPSSVPVNGNPRPVVWLAKGFDGWPRAMSDSLFVFHDSPGPSEYDGVHIDMIHSMTSESSEFPERQSVGHTVWLPRLDFACRAEFALGVGCVDTNRAGPSL
jgi:hypothetical protein